MAQRLNCDPLSEKPDPSIERISKATFPPFCLPGVSMVGRHEFVTGMAS
jgi:hypothetical protein